MFLWVLNDTKLPWKVVSLRATRLTRAVPPLPCWGPETQSQQSGPVSSGRVCTGRPGAFLGSCPGRPPHCRRRSQLGRRQRWDRAAPGPLSRRRRVSQRCTSPIWSFNRARVQKPLAVAFMERPWALSDLTSAGSGNKHPSPWKPWCWGGAGCRVITERGLRGPASPRRLKAENALHAWFSGSAFFFLSGINLITIKTHHSAS